MFEIPAQPKVNGNLHLSSKASALRENIRRVGQWAGELKLIGCFQTNNNN